jgi:hypothetical protein
MGFPGSVCPTCIVGSQPRYALAGRGITPTEN